LFIHGQETKGKGFLDKNQSLKDLTSTRVLESRQGIGGPGGEKPDPYSPRSPGKREEKRRSLIKSERKSLTQKKMESGARDD